MRAALMDVEGVRDAEVSLEEGTARVLCEQHVQVDPLIRAVEEAGYGAELIEEEAP